MTRPPEPPERPGADAGPVDPSTQAGAPAEPTWADEPTSDDGPRVEQRQADEPRADGQRAEARDGEALHSALGADLPRHEVPSDEAAWERAARAAAHDEESLAGGVPTDAPDDEVAPPTRLVPRVAPAPQDTGPEPAAGATTTAGADVTDRDGEPAGDELRALDPAHAAHDDAGRPRDDVPDGPTVVRRPVLPPGTDPWEASAPDAPRLWELPAPADPDPDPDADTASPAGVDLDTGANVDVDPVAAADTDPDADVAPGFAPGTRAAGLAGDEPDALHEGPGDGAEAVVGDDAAGSVPVGAAPVGAPTVPGAADPAVAGPERAPVTPTATNDAPVPGDAPPPEAWRTLGRSLRPRANRAQVLAGLLCGMLGFAVVVQVRQTHDEGLSTLRQSELVGILDQTTRQGDELEREADSLERTRQKLLSGSTSSQAALDAAMSSAATQGILAGRLPAEGPGLSITVADPDGVVAARSLLNLLEELRNAGAEAVQLNDLRITASSYVVEGEGRGVVVDGVAVEPPYRWLVIGDPATMGNAMEIPGGAFATIRNDGGRPTAVQQDDVSILATRTVPEPRFATPLAPEEG